MSSAWGLQVAGLCSQGDLRLPLSKYFASYMRVIRGNGGGLPIALLRASDLRRPVTTTTTSLLSRTVATPTVRAIRGTAATSLLKKRAFARIVS